MHRVVITGIGIISPLGLNRATTWEGLLEGRSGVNELHGFELDGLDTTIGAEVKGFDPIQYLGREEALQTNRYVQFAAVAAREAMTNSGLVINERNAADVGVAVSSGIGGIVTLSEQIELLQRCGPEEISPFLMPLMSSNMAAAYVSIQLGAKGPSFSTTSACSTGTDAIGQAYELLHRGDIKVMVTGGSEAPFCRLGIAAFNAARALSTRNDAPQQASRPFDAHRDGFVMGEGAAVLILEELDYARERGATIIAEITGYGATADAFHMMAPSEGGEGAVRSMEMAIRKANIDRSKVDYINAHGTSTQLNDKTETQAIKKVFGEDAYRIAISSTKSMVGHMMGAAGAIEAAICAMAIRESIIPPTVNYEFPDPECDLDYVPNVPRSTPVHIAMSNSFGFGGHNSCLVIQEYAE